MTKLKFSIGPVIALMACQRAALAGMPSVSFSDAAELRLQTISFFLVGLLVSAAVVLWSWNAVAKDFSRLPRLTYRAALGVVVLWGLLFIIVLTMISGARELMTPGAWEKQGQTYKLRTDDPKEQSEQRRADQLLARRSRLQQLAAQLKQFATRHEGAYPLADEADQIPESFWRPGDPPKMRYVYVPSLKSTDGAKPLAYEPQSEDDSFVLFANGTVEQLPFETILRLSPTETPP